jgi:hypothetical protein
MRIAAAVRMPVVISMVPDPPQRPVLAGEHAARGEDELKAAGRLEGTMRQQAVIAKGDTEDLDQRCQKENCRGGCTCTDYKYQSAAEMQ